MDIIIVHDVGSGQIDFRLNFAEAKQILYGLYFRRRLMGLGSLDHPGAQEVNDLIACLETALNLPLTKGLCDPRVGE